MGYIYDNGLGRPQDKSEAFKWYMLAAEQGAAASQFNVGLFLFHGEGVEQNHSRAFRYFSLSARQGDAESQFYLGAQYGGGLGIEVDMSKGYMWTVLSMANGLDAASEMADHFAKMMRPELIAATRAAAIECLSSDYQNCD